VVPGGRGQEANTHMSDDATGTNGLTAPPENNSATRSMERAKRADMMGSRFSAVGGRLCLFCRLCCCWSLLAYCLTRWEDRGSCTGTVRSVALTEGYCRYSLQPPSQPLRVPGTGRSLSGFLAAGCGSAGGCGLTERARRESFKKAKVGDID